MSWSFSGIGKVEAVCRAIDEEAAKQTGQCKEEMDAAVPHLKALLQENFSVDNPNLVLEISASGSGYARDGKQVNRSCAVEIKQHWKRLCLMVAFVACLAFMLPGCDKKVTPEQLGFLQTSVTAAKERATAFMVIGPTLKAADPTKADILAAHVKSIGNERNNQALALANFMQAVQKKNGVDAATKATLQDMAATAQGDVENLASFRKNLLLTDDQVKWFDAEGEALKNQADNLAKLVIALNPPTATATGTGTSTATK